MLIDQLLGKLSLAYLDELRQQKAKIAEERANLEKQQITAQSELERFVRHEITLDKLGGVSVRYGKS